VEIRQLELFLAVIDCNSVTRAAEKACVSPGAISMQLRNLADEPHTDLFVRQGKHLVPTPAALRLAEHARVVVRQMRDIEFEFDASPATDSRPVGEAQQRFPGRQHQSGSAERCALPALSEA
jgi:DNA-binding transcriptional LysR family regulator